MAGRLGRRVVHFANLPIKLLMPSSFSNISEIAIKTIPSSKVFPFISLCFRESTYPKHGGKKKKGGGLSIAKPDYKKAYITLKNPLSISPDLYPLRMIEEEKRNMNKQSKSEYG
ncbi:hypothetical protein RJ641_018680 [Dillenia turbinata]|uniref:Uncharacterized protein n=1 Tax=Dillenia turbinata TaxID=194707 RepID=A0AAN8UKN9_9MAGN